MAQIEIAGIKTELAQIIKEEIDLIFPSLRIPVYRTIRPKIAVLPAINLETADYLTSRHAFGGVKQVDLRINLFIWVKIYDPEKAEDQLLDIMKVVLDVLERTENRKRDGLWDDLVTEVTEERTEFGIIEDPENFLQGVRIPIYLTKRLIGGV